jgi:hypothetical protein
MRRSLAAIAAALVLLSSVSGATAAQPDASGSPAPIVEQTPAVDPAPSLEPAPIADAAPDPSALPDPPTASIAEPTVPSTGNPAGTHGARAATDPTDRWIVVIKPGTDVYAAVDRQGQRIGFATDRTYRNALRGYAATLDRAQVTALSHDASVSMIVADEKIEAEVMVGSDGVARAVARP